MLKKKNEDTAQDHNVIMLLQTSSHFKLPMNHTRSRDCDCRAGVGLGFSQYKISFHTIQMLLVQADQTLNSEAGVFSVPLLV
jgi:hypothetical protein